MKRLHAVDRGHEAGMSLSEALISLLLLSMMMVAFLGLLDTTARVSKVQGNVADSTENIRYSMAALVRLVRMAGTGGLPLVRDTGSGWASLAIEVWDDQVSLLPDDLGGREPVDNSDILLVRGIIVNQIYTIQGETSLDFSANTITIPDVSPYPGGGDQFLDYPTSYRNRPVVLSSNQFNDINTGVGGVRHYGGYRVVEVADEAEAVKIDDTPDAAGITWMTIKFDTSGDGTELNPGGTFVPPTPRQVYAVGFLDEIKFFVALNDAGEPSLYRFLGNGYADEMVPNIASLQVALGCDLNGNNTLDAGEWFLTAGNSTMPGADQLNTLREVRLSVVTRSAAPETKWSDKSVMPENMTEYSGDALKYRYRVISVNTALRSHPPLEAS